MTIPMSKSKKDGLYLVSLGIAVFLLFGLIAQHSAGDADEDFRAVVYGARCLIHRCDPYNESELFRFYQNNFPEPVATHLRSHTLTLYVNLPATVLFVTPLAMLPFAAASAIWSILTAASLVLAALLMWDIGSEYAPTLSGALIALSLVSGAIVLGNGNPSGIVVALSMIALWCFLKNRFVIAGILALALSLALKPHDPGLIWFYLFLAGGSLRKRALQTMAIAVLFSIAGFVFVSSLAPRWFPELRSNLAVMSAPGGNNDPGPAGSTSRARATEMIVSLQSAVSLVRDDPRFYNSITYLVCGALLLVWLAATLRSHWSQPLSLIALAAITAVTLLVTYHRAYDARLLMLTIPACALLYAESRTVGKAALVITALAVISSGELPYAILKLLAGPPETARSGAFGSLSALALDHSAPILLLLMAIFYTAVYVHLARFGLGVQRANPTQIEQNLQA